MRPACVSYRHCLFVCLTLVMAGTSARAGLDFEARVACARRIEAVYHDLRTWPAENKGPKPSLDSVLPVDATRRQVQQTLASSVLLQREWDAGLSTADLQAEMDRMARDTHAPAQLRRLFAALHDDPLLVAECLVRPVLSDRRARALYAASVQSTGAAAAPYALWLQTRLHHAGEFRSPDDESALTLPVVTGQPCTYDTWQPTAADLPARNDAAAVWTGAEMLLVGGGSRPGVRYSSATDTWRAMSDIGAPAGANAGFWTGTEMITWSRDGGGRYDPVQDVWQSLPSDGAPLGRSGWTGVWTGSSLIVWGGSDATTGTVFGDGARLDLAAGRWTPVGTLNAPSPRSGHAAVWTGTEMIVWGGYDGLGDDPYLGDGGRYDSLTDTWRPVSMQGAPGARSGHTAVWTGSEMIIWGGKFGLSDTSWVSSTGARYAPALDAWTTLPTTGAPSARRSHTAVWTGADMIVWGGAYHDPFDPSADALLSDGARYSPDSNNWIALSYSGLAARAGHTAVWAPEGGEMLVWGGYGANGALTNGSRYRPAVNGWYPTATSGVPERRSGHTAVWTGAEMIVWGGSGSPVLALYLGSGGRYDPALDAWRPMQFGPPGRQHHSAVWTGTEMVVHGGEDGWHGGPNDPTYFGMADTWAYSPATDSWRSLAPGATRTNHTAIWTGSRMLVWGGYSFWEFGAPPEQYLSDGRAFDPATNAWTPLAGAGEPAGRQDHVAAWTGLELLVWGGWDGQTWRRDGALFNPVTGLWRELPTNGAPDPQGKAGAWATDRLVLWGGPAGDGARVVPGAEAWIPLPAAGAPPPTSSSTATWTGREVVFWAAPTVGGRYDAAQDLWLPLGSKDAPSARVRHAAVWTGSHVIVWGGSHQNSGGRYCACLASPVAAVPALTAAHDGASAVLHWSSVAGADAYDVVSGAVSDLQRSAGDFSSATERCLADDLVTDTATDEMRPEAGDAFWYLVRGVSCAGGSYEEGEGGQLGSRDAEVAASSAACR